MGKIHAIHKISQNLSSTSPNQNYFIKTPTQAKSLSEPKDKYFTNCRRLDFNLSKLKSTAKAYFDLSKMPSIQFAKPTKSGYRVVKDPEELASDPELFEMAFKAYNLIRNPEYEIFFTTLYKLRKGKPRILLLNYQRHTMFRRTEETRLKKIDAIGRSFFNRETIYQASNTYSASEFNKSILHEWGHALVRAAYPIYPYTLGRLHDVRHEHPSEDQTNFTNAWTEGVATAFEFLEEIRKEGSLSFDKLKNRKDSSAYYTLYHKRRNEHFIGAVLATYLGNSRGNLNAMRFKAFIDTLSHGGKCNRAHFGFKQFVADFVQEHPEEQTAFYVALDKYGMMGLVPEKYLKTL